jgi:hypothetical protein
MFGRNDIEKWNDSYDNYTCPFGIYYDLVVKQKEDNRKIELMGAWKTGCLRIDKNGKEYEDQEGTKYSFTNRWKKEAPVGYEVWNSVSKNIDEIKVKIPSKFPENKKPDVVTELESKKGFGFIWSIFVLHCIHPNVYPLYDQHVYRAFRYIVSNGNDFGRVAPSNWIDYSAYQNFFSKLVDETSLPFWKIDRALWAYGKYLKKIKKREKNSNTNENVIQENDNNDNSDWTHTLTFKKSKVGIFWKIVALLYIVGFGYVILRWCVALFGPFVVNALDFFRHAMVVVTNFFGQIKSQGNYNFWRGIIVLVIIVIIKKIFQNRKKKK